MFVKPLTHLNFGYLTSQNRIVLLNIILASDMRVFPGLSPEEILQESREVLHTNGEWELINITVAHSTLVLNVGSYSEIKYFVSTADYFNYSTITSYEL